MNKLYAIVSYLIINMVSILLIDEIGKLGATIILYLCLTAINISIVIFLLDKEATNEQN